jgi:hypothetical protein
MIIDPSFVDFPEQVFCWKEGMPGSSASIACLQARRFPHEAKNLTEKRARF